MDKKIPDVSGLVKKTDFNSKITEIEGKIPIITGLATSSALTAVENKIPDVSDLVTKTDYNTKISDIEKKITDHNHDEYITTPEFNGLTTENYKARLKQAYVITKTDLDTELKKISDRVTSNKSKHLFVEIELKKLERFDAAYFRGKNYFDGDITQNYLVFQPVYKYFEKTGSKVSSWRSKGLSNEKIGSTTTTSNNKFTANLIYDNARIKVKFNGDFLKQDKTAYNHGQKVNIYIVYELIPDSKNSSITL